MHGHVLQEVRLMRFEELYGRQHRRELTMVEAAEILGVIDRTFRRWSTSYEADAVTGLQGRRLDRPTCSRALADGKWREAHRKKRPRKPLPGMMLHQDGSTHEWVPGYQWDLFVTLDNATTAIYSTFFVEEEGTMSSLQGLREVIEAQGLFSSLYTDRGTHY